MQDFVVLADGKAATAIVHLREEPAVIDDNPAQGRKLDISLPRVCIGTRQQLFFANLFE
ncbi:hypothetical protein AAFG13_06730 [Bradyrhizobium sp. B124]|uniref:hypothetical protein n=1 Tax=Bradyrhizobium sp. B124 TaxID=3140245 RepID=UPI00318335BB